MATMTWTTTGSVNDNSQFRLLFSPISASLSSSAWNLEYQQFATGSSWVDAGYPIQCEVAAATEIWSMGDALQATAPLFMKIEYGRSRFLYDGDGNWPAFKITWGSSYTGSNIINTLHKTVTGTVVGEWVTINTNPDPLGYLDHYASGASSRYNVGYYITGIGGTTNCLTGFSIERRKNTDGSDANTGFLIATWGGINGFSPSQVAKATTRTVGPARIDYFGIAGTSNGYTLDGDSAIAPLLYGLGPAQIGTNLCAHPKVITGGSTFVASPFGSPITYISLRHGAPVPSDPTNVSAYAMAMRYE